MTVLVVAGLVDVALLGLLMIGLMRKNTAAARHLETAEQTPEVSPAGAEARDIAGVGLNGQIIGVRVRESDRATLLAFMSTTCFICNGFWKGFADAEKMATLGDTRLIIVTYGDGHEVAANVAEVAPSGIPIVMSTIAWQTYGVPGSPHFVMISGTTGLITAKGSTGDWDGLLDLIGLATEA